MRRERQGHPLVRSEELLVVEVFELERLGWDQIRGLPLVPDADIGTGRFRIVCSRELGGEGIEETEAVGEEVETMTPAPVTPSVN